MPTHPPPLFFLSCIAFQEKEPARETPIASQGGSAKAGASVDGAEAPALEQEGGGASSPSKQPGESCVVVVVAGLGRRGIRRVYQNRILRDGRFALWNCTSACDRWQNSSKDRSKHVGQAKSDKLFTTKLVVARSGARGVGGGGGAGGRCPFSQT